MPTVVLFLDRRKCFALSRLFWRERDSSLLGRQLPVSKRFTAPSHRTALTADCDRLRRCGRFGCAVCKRVFASRAFFGRLQAAGCKPGVFRRTANGGMQAKRFPADCERRDGCKAGGRLRETTVGRFSLSNSHFSTCARKRTWLREFPLKPVWTRASVVS